jgi:hypothetical protein
MMEAPVLTQAKGINGTLQLLPDRIRIVREGWLSNLYGRHTQTELPLAQIASTEFKRTAGGLAGYLAFHDDSERERYEDFCVSFLKLQEHRFEAIYKAIEERRALIMVQHAATHLDYIPQETL